MKDNRIRYVMDESLSHMEFTDKHKQKVLTEVKGEMVVKRKISTALALALVIVLISGIALAVLSFRDAARQVVETEQTDGYYKDWPIEKKVSLVKALTDLGYAEATTEVKQLIAGLLVEDRASNVADDVLVAFTGKEVSEISFMEIMQAAWGPFSEWSKEEQAWYSQLLVNMGLQGSDHTLYVNPTGSVNEEQAIAIATREIARGFGVEESVLDSYTITTSFQVPEFAEPGDMQPYWYVEFMATDEAIDHLHPFSAFWVFVHPETGELLEKIEDQVASYHIYQEKLTAMENDPLHQEVKVFYEAHESNPRWWNLETKAEWSRKFAGRIRERIKEEPETWGLIDASMASFDYGVPDDKAISEEEAFQIALNVLVEQLGRKEEELTFFTHRYDVFYDITDHEKPLWKFLFRMPSEYDSDENYGKKVLAYYGRDGERLPNLKVELNANTGEVVRAFPFDYADANSIETYKLSM